MVRHLVVVDAYDGLLETLSGVDDEREAARGLGLPLADLAARLGCRITVLDWNEWISYEAAPAAFCHWVPTPVTRPRNTPALRRVDMLDGASGLRYVSVPARDPESRAPLAIGLSPRSHGLLANSDPLFLLAYCLDIALADLYRADPFDLVLLPMWGGLGYVAQLARATGVSGSLDVPFAIVVTDTSAARQAANLEGAWTRPAITRRQMEDVSLALADVVLTFGRRGDAVAAAGRLHDAQPAVRVPRRIPGPVINALERIAQDAPRPAGCPVQLFLHEPQDGASGALIALDAVTILHRRGMRLPQPVVSAGHEMVFAPMKPRGFVEYWSSRGFAQELVAAGQWRWAPQFSASREHFSVRLYPSRFDHLPSVWTELARGGMVLLSAAAAEGLAPGEDLPSVAMIPGEPDADGLAAAIERLLLAGPERLEGVRRRICAQVVAAHRDGASHRLDAAAVALERAAVQRRPGPELARVARLFVDRRRRLRDLDGEAASSTTTTPRSAKRRRLTVVVTCYEMGPWLRETIESVWASTRRPDEVLLVDDGSATATTRDVIEALEADARGRGIPLTVRRQSNQGLAAARNAGLAAASGELISFIDGDDLIEPAFYETAAALLERYPELGGVAAWALCFGDGVPDGFWNAPQPELPLLLVENPVIVPCMMNADMLRALGGYDARQRYNYEDWELSVRLVASGRPIVTIPRYLKRYRVRPASLLRTMTDTQNQTMRELMLDRHRDTVARFATETAMMIEHHLARRLYAAPPSAPRRADGVSPPRPVLDLGRRLARTTRALLRGPRR